MNYTAGSRGQQKYRYGRMVPRFVLVLMSC